ncbi:MAG TPA: hypothetical protein VGR47_09005 [Terracidiphilus sp.]|nr:hypothetical protein [Terracidiphilus sp.]
MELKNGAGVRFIEAFARNSADGCIAELITQFCEQFLYAGPAGSQWVGAGDFALALPKRKQIFEQAGHRSTELAGAQELWLGERYVLVRTRWRFAFELDTKAPYTLETESDFVVDAGAEPFRILVYLAHQDIVEMLRRRIPA